jgi:membrane protein DedA with SNARE-associated domain
VGDLLYDLVGWMSSLPSPWIYVMILSVSYGENVIPPIPGDMIVVFGGYLAGIGRLDLGVVILLSTIGGAAGFMTMYGIGVRLGTAILNPGRFRWLPKARLLRSRDHLHRWGGWLIGANRFLSGLRSVISLSVGMAHKPAGTTLALATGSALLWTALLAVAGFYVGENWDAVGGYLRQYGVLVVGLMLAFAVVQGVRFWRSRRVPSEGSG